MSEVKFVNISGTVVFGVNKDEAINTILRYVEFKQAQKPSVMNRWMQVWKLVGTGTVADARQMYSILYNDDMNITTAAVYNRNLVIGGMLSKLRHGTYKYVGDLKIEG